MKRYVVKLIYGGAGPQWFWFNAESIQDALEQANKKAPGAEILVIKMQGYAP